MLDNDNIMTEKGSEVVQKRGQQRKKIIKNAPCAL